MNEHTYLIVGGGMTAASALQGIREEDGEGDITVLSAEAHPPYDRPPLSKHLWFGKKTESEIWRELPERVAFHAGTTVVELDLERKEAKDDRGQVHRFEKLLLATGGTPRRLPFGGDQIIYFRGVESYRRLRELTEERNHFAVIGGGFIGSEIAAALAMEDKQVTMIFPEPAIGARLFPTDLAAYLNDYYAEHGVQIVAGDAVTDFEGAGTDFTLATESGRKLQVQGAVAGIGILPNDSLAADAGLQVENGIVVNESLQSSHPDVYAAGDVASFFDPLLEKRRRVEHEDAANSMGRIAGRVMAGAQVAYEDSPMFYSDMFQLGYEAVGELDSSLETVADWQEPFRKGVVYYLADGRVRGVLLWDIWGKVDEARHLLAEPGPWNEEELKGRI